MTPLLVIHDLGADGGAEWAAGFSDWPGRVVAPDLPGHGSAPAPLGGHYELGDAVFAVAEHLQPDPPVVVGVGRNGHSARIIALGGRAAALVLVDGLGGPWLDTLGRNAQLRDIRRRILATPAALAPHAPPGIDPRAEIVLPQTNRDHVVRTAALVEVPTLVVETPRSPTPDAGELVGAFPRGSLVRTADHTPETVARAVVAWWASVPA
jgi:pimeloyl-ACP methyl ester carboxylesterase